MILAALQSKQSFPFVSDVSKISHARGQNQWKKPCSCPPYPLMLADSGISQERAGGSHFNESSHILVYKSREAGGVETHSLRVKDWNHSLMPPQCRAGWRMDGPHL